MSITIIDGQGTGFTAGVTDEHRVKVAAITATTEHHANHHHGTAYNLLFQQIPEEPDPSAGIEGDFCFLYSLK